jgi:hypothetical protein
MINDDSWHEGSKALYPHLLMNAFGESEWPGLRGAVTDICTTWIKIAMATRRTMNRVPLDSSFFSSNGGATAIGAADASTGAGATGAGATGAGATGAGATGADFGTRGVETGTGRAATGAAGTTAMGGAVVVRGVTTGGGAGEADFLAVGVLGAGDWMFGSIFSRLVVSTPLERS